MPAAARGRLTEILTRQAAPAVPSAQLKVAPGDLRVEVEGIGRLAFPVPGDQARQLCQLGRPARFGRGEQTLTDPTVRDTWEIPKSLVNIEWAGGLDAVLEPVREALGLPSDCGLAADLHSMLVYERGQFFVSHQDSEKDDMMVATLVVILPSAHTGGDLVIEHGEGAKAYKGLKSGVRLVAFYADCRHQVRPVKSGYRITLIYNLLVQGGTSRPATRRSSVSWRGVWRSTSPPR
jgi:2OG-Fe(II) oxygenase superfamily